MPLHSSLPLAVCVAVLCGACTGSVVDGAAAAARVPNEVAPSGPAGVPSCALGSAGHAPIRRLSKTELQHSLVDVLGVSDSVVAAIDDDTAGANGFTNDSATLTTDALRLAQTITAVEAAVGQSLSSPMSPFLSCAGGAPDAACARVQLSKLARRAYRRPLASAEVDELMTVYAANEADGFAAALGAAMQRVLLSPSFMYLTAFSGDSTTAGQRLSPHELASRLSYLLWSSVPDETLLTLADDGSLTAPAVLEAQVKRMLADPKAARLVDDFFGQWLGFTRIANTQTVIRQGMTDALRAQLLQETRSFIAGLIADDKSLMALITADYTYLNQELAARYGVVGVSGSSFVKASLQGTGRGGILGQGAMLSVLANPADSRPVLRGFFILNDIMCEPPPPPPANVDTSQVTGNTGATPTTVRERLAQHVEGGSACRGCHVQMDALGLSQEQFDQLGMFRTRYANGLPIDASGSVFGESFTDYQGMNAILAKQTNVRTCLTRKLVSYALSRAPTGDEKCLATQLAEAHTRDDSSFSGLVTGLVSSDAFTLNVTDSR